MDHFLKMTKDMELNPKLLLHLGMDGPSVNRKFESILTDQLNEELLHIGSCNLHKVLTAFRKGYNAFDVDIESFIFDLHFFSSCLLVVTNLGLQIDEAGD